MDFLLGSGCIARTFYYSADSGGIVGAAAMVMKPKELTTGTEIKAAYKALWQKWAIVAGHKKGLSLNERTISNRRQLMMHTSLAALNGQWDKAECAAGFRARFAAIPDSEQAHHCWRVGYEDADTEMLESSRHSRIVAKGREDDYPDTWGLLFDAEGDARGNGIPFDDERTAPWKEGWIDADINFGVHGIASL